ncbi:MAG: hypothetical protein JO035_13345 [Betaproteobacteria bacterium]|nr:hypothetical protein [Betaproteobacteria bacterium]
MGAAMPAKAAPPPSPEHAVAASSGTQPRRLRVGLFVDSREQPRWVAEAFSRVARAGFAEISLIAVAGEPATEPPALWKLYDRMDRWTFARGAQDPAGRVDLVRAVPHRKFAQLGSLALHELGLDLDVAFAVGRFDDGLLDGIARYGVWRFYFGGGSHEAGAGEALAGFREVAENAALSGSGLKVRLAAGAASRFAYQSWSRTYPLSAARNRAQLLAKTAAFAERALRELHRSGYGWLEQCRLFRGPEESRVAYPGTLELARDVGAIAARIGRRGLEKALNVEQWFIAYRFRESRFGDARAIPPDLRGFTRLTPPKDRYWADPFPLAMNGRYFVFFEELPFKAGKAHISMVEIDPVSGGASQPVRVLERPYHLSYPFLLEHEGQLYMIPETARHGTVELYRCVDFPRSWKLERVLIDGLRCVDATFHRGHDRWWLFANVAAKGSRMYDDELHLFHAEKLGGEWTPHPRNPVKSDARCARPAGQLYWRNGALYRPAQICAPLYGSGLSINRVLRLTPTEYAERQVERILPSRREGLLGLHTVNRAGDLTVVDAFMRRPRF